MYEFLKMLPRELHVFCYYEEFEKFGYPVAETVLQGLIPEEEFHIWYLLTRMKELVCNHVTNGWTDEDILLFSNLAK